MGKSRSWQMGMLDWNLPLPAFEVHTETCALLVIDMQYGDADPDRGFGRLVQVKDPARASYYFSRLRGLVIPNIARLLSFFRNKQLKVIYLALGSLLPDGSDMPPARRQRDRRMRGSEGIGTVFPRGSREYAILEELAPREDELVINKTSNSAFNSSHIERVLLNTGIKSLVIVGVGTDVCVETTARDAADRGYNCILVDDACATLDQAAHDAAMLNFARWFGRVTATNELVEELRRDLDSASHIRRPWENGS